MRQDISQTPPIPSKIEQLKGLFPEYFDKDGKFLIKKFTQDIQNKTEISKETYSLEWLGKSYARVLATDPVRTLLRENEEWNKKKENKKSENLLIKGDNLEVLKHLVHAYENEIKMIYIDPPYNTGEDGFIYQDDRNFTPEELSKLAGINCNEAKRILKFLDSKSNSHSAWLTFMYPRLYIARRLLKEDGAIFISIDENEISQLRLLMDEIFGEENFVGEVIRKTKSTTADKNTGFNFQHDYLLIYSKNINKIKLYGDEKNFDSYKNPDNDPNGEWCSTDPSAKSGGESLYFPIKNPYTGKIDYPPKGRYWAFSKQTLEKYIKEGRIVFKKTHKNNERGFIFKRYKKDIKDIYNSVNSLFATSNEFMNQVGTKEIKSLFGNEYFNNPKPTIFIKKIIQMLLPLNGNEEAYVMDFFAGSGTTADAVMQLNSEDKGKRKFILVQLPEPINPKKNKATYKFVKNELNIKNPTIFDITRERIIRSAKKILTDKQKEIENINKQINHICQKEKQTKSDTNKLVQLKNNLKQKEEELENLKNLDFGFIEFETIPLPNENIQDIDELTKDTLYKEIIDKNALLTTWKIYDGIKLHKKLKEIDFNGYKGYYLNNTLYLIDYGFNIDNLASLIEKIAIDKDFFPSKIIIYGYVFDSKTQRELFENINNLNKKDLEKIELIIRY